LRLSLVFAALAFLVFHAQAQPPDLRKIGIDQKLGAQVPLDLPFKDETGKPILLKEYFGKKPVALMLIFYQCRSGCAIEFEGAVSAINAMKSMLLGRDYDVVSISINPKETSELAAAKKQGYATLIKAPRDVAGWHFLTGEESSSKAVADAVGFRFTYDRDRDLINHATALFVLTPDGRVSKVHFGSDYVGPLVYKSLKDASQGKIGELVLETRMFGCIQVDPATGQMTINMMRLMQIMGFATLIGLAGMICYMSIKYRRLPIRIDKRKGGATASR